MLNSSPGTVCQISDLLRGVFDILLIMQFRIFVIRVCVWFMLLFIVMIACPPYQTVLRWFSGGSQMADRVDSISLCWRSLRFAALF